MSANTILWIYIVLLVVGGVIGCLKAKSKVSLISSVIFAAVLALCAAGVIMHEMIYVCLSVLLVVFGIRLGKTKKFMPSGMLLILTLITLVLYGVLAGRV